MDVMKTAALLALGFLTVGYTVGCGGGSEAKADDGSSSMDGGASATAGGARAVVYVEHVVGDHPYSDSGVLSCNHSAPNGHDDGSSYRPSWQDCCPEGFAAVGWNSAMGGVICLEGG